MGPLEITGTARLILGLATGVAFGFILQKGQALKFHKIIDALRLKDFTKIGVLGKVTLPQLLGIGVWLVVTLVALVLGTAIWFLSRIDRGARKKEQVAQLTPSPARN